MTDSASPGTEPGGGGIEPAPPTPRPAPTAGAPTSGAPSSGAPSTAPPSTGPAGAALTRKMLDDIFGDVLPTITSDERDEQDGRGSGDADRDRWYRDNRPPHHG